MSDRHLGPPRIPPAAPPTPGLDVEALVVEGRRHLRALSARTWTDHNLGDPGITLLESIAFGCTDLAFRATAPMLALLGPAPDVGAGGFFGPETILPCAPVTAADLRRRVLDVEGVRDAEVRPATGEDRTAADDPRFPNGALPEPAIRIDDRTCVLGTDPARGQRTLDLAGLLVIELEFESPDPDVDEATHRRSVATEVQAAFHSARPLGTDLLAIRARPVSPVRFCADLDVHGGADPDRIRAEIFVALSTMLEPPIAFRTLSEMQASGASLDQIFDGPRPRNGFIADLPAAAPTIIRASDVYRIMMAVDGVKRVSRLTIVAEPPPGREQPSGGDAWSTLIAPGAVPRLDIARSTLRCFVGPVPLPPRRADLLSRVERLRRAHTSPRLRAAETDDPPPAAPPSSSPLPSLQGTLPAVYGVGHRVPPTDPRRAASADQLRAFLMLFDQLRADFVAQLGAASTLLSSTAPDTDRTHVAGDCEGVPGFDRLRADGDADPGALLERDDARREARIEARLQHLLARHGDGFGPNERALRDPVERRALIGDMARHLAALGQTSGRRGQGRSLLDDAEPSALVRRLMTRLGLDGEPDAARGAEPPPAETYQTRSGQWRFYVLDAAGERALRSTRGWNDPVDMRAALDATLQQSVAADHFEVYRSRSTWRLRLPDPSADTLLAIGARGYPDEPSARAAAIALAAAMPGPPASPAPQVIEHILLRPRRAGGRIMAHAPCTDAEPCGVDDPYSHRLTICLPAWPARFVDLRRRVAAEEIVRAEAPAHLAVRICWLDEESAARLARDHARFMVATREALRRPGDPSRAARDDAADTLVETLAGLRSAYPEVRLFDDRAPEPGPPVVLNHSRLGARTAPREEHNG